MDFLARTLHIGTQGSPTDAGRGRKNTPNRGWIKAGKNRIPYVVMNLRTTRPKRSKQKLALIRTGVVWVGI
jgi:hypothetical protein